MKGSRVSGVVQIVLLLGMVAFASSPSMTKVIATTFCVVFVFTWSATSRSKLAYDGWLSSFLFTFIYYITPAAALVYVFLGQQYLPLFVVAALALQGEAFREHRTSERQLGWAALPVLSLALGLWLQSGDVREVALATFMAISVVCTSITTVRMGDPEVVLNDLTSQSVKCDRTAESRSFRHAA